MIFELCYQFCFPYKAKFRAIGAYISSTLANKCFVGSLPRALRSQCAFAIVSRPEAQKKMTADADVFCIRSSQASVWSAGKSKSLRPEDAHEIAIERFGIGSEICRMGV